MTHWWCRTCRRAVPFDEGPACCVPQTTVPVCLSEKDGLLDVEMGNGVQLGAFCNLYGCTIRSDTRIGAYVEIQTGVVIGRRCKIGSHSFLCTGVTVEDGCFLGHGVMFTNDRHPRAVRPDGEVVGDGDWTLERTLVRAGASIGSGAVILPGMTIGAGAVVGAGSVVAQDVPAGVTVRGMRARMIEPPGNLTDDELQRLARGVRAPGVPFTDEDVRAVAAKEGR